MQWITTSGFVSASTVAASAETVIPDAALASVSSPRSRPASSGATSIAPTTASDSFEAASAAAYVVFAISVILTGLVGVWLW